MLSSICGKSSVAHTTLNLKQGRDTKALISQLPLLHSAHSHVCALHA